MSETDEGRYSPTKVQGLIARAKAHASDTPMYSDDLELYRELWHALEALSGEPSDAQVEAAHSAFWGHDDITGSHEQMRAVLRAAGKVLL